MGAQIPFSLPTEMLVAVLAESSWNTYTDWGAGDICHVTKCGVPQAQARDNRADTRATRSVLERMTTRKSGKWNLEGYLLGASAAGSAPDLDALYTAVFGTKTTNAGVSVVYSLSDSQTPSSLEIVRTTRVEQHILNGCIPGKLSFKAGPQWTVAAEGENVWQAWMNAITVSGSNGASTLTAQSADMAAQIDDNAKFVVISGSNEYGPFTVTDVTGTTITFSGGTLGGDVTNGIMEPWRPTPTTTGSPATDLVGAITLDGGEVDFASFELNVETGLYMHNKQYGTDRATYGYYGRRIVSGTLGVHYRRDMGTWYNKARSFSSIAMSVTAGSDSGGSGARHTFALPYVQFMEIPNSELGDANSADPGMLNFAWIALGSSGEDEFTYTID